MTTYSAMVMSRIQTEHTQLRAVEKDPEEAETAVAEPAITPQWVQMGVLGFYRIHYIGLHVEIHRIYEKNTCLHIYWNFDGMQFTLLQGKHERYTKMYCI
jgi:hypothetical protein